MSTVQDSLEPDDPERAFTDKFLEALAEGDQNSAVEWLRQLKNLQAVELAVVADMLERRSSAIFPCILMTKNRGRGRLSKQVGQSASSPFEKFLVSVEDRDAEGAAQILRSVERLSEHEVQRFADLLDDDPKVKTPSKA